MAKLNFQQALLQSAVSAITQKKCYKLQCKQYNLEYFFFLCNDPKLLISSVFQ